MDTYKYKAPASAQNFKLLPEDDYDFEVTRCTEPYKSTKGNWVLPVRLNILPHRITVFANPWQGVDKNGEPRDIIAEFLLCVGRAPKEGEEPDWGSVVGSRGRCRLKAEIPQRGKLAGQEINTVAWFIEPREPDSSTKGGNLVIRKSGTAAGDNQDEPDKIPF